MASPKMESDPPKPRPARKAAAKAGTSASGTGASGPKAFERKRGGEARQIADLMPAIGRTAFRRFGFVQSSVVTRWPEIVGAGHARHCMPESIRFAPGEKANGVLQLVVTPAHAPLIQHVVPEIMERVNRFFGYRAVAKVKLRQGVVQAPRPKGPAPLPPTTAKAAAPNAVPMDLGDSLRAIGDPELRAVLESLARSLGEASTRQDTDNRDLRK
jgi:hypothetical protein